MVGNLATVKYEMKKPRVAIIDNCIDITGAINAILGYAEFAREDFDFLFILPTNSRAGKRIKERGFKVIELSFLEVSKNWKSLILYIPQLVINGSRLNHIVNRENIDIIHVNDFYNMAGVMSKALGGSFKLLTHIRFVPDKFPFILVNAWVKLNLKFAESIICVSHAVRKGIEDHQKIKVIYDGLPRFNHHQPKKIEYKECVSLLYLGHYIRGKGQDFAVEAFYRAYKKNPFIRLKFVGGDMGMEKNRAFKACLIERARELGIQEVITFSGPTSDVQEEILSADIMLNFSESESFSMTCLEALLIGTPLIATDCGGPAELFIHKESGWLVPNRNINEMTQAIIQLSENVEIRNKLSKNSSSFVKAKFSTGCTSGLLRSLYNSTLNGL